MRKLIVALLLGAVTLLGAMPALALHYSTIQEYEKATGKKIETFNEAPMLKVKVAAGELPPLEERLPEEPLVEDPVEAIGEYGGELRQLRMAWSPRIYHTQMLREFWLNYQPPYRELVPNVLKAWEQNEDSSKFTLFLRKGLKWSDGHLFTAEDLIFWLEDIIGNDELYPSKPGSLMAGGEMAKMRRIDDYTVELSFAAPSPLFLYQATRWGGLDFPETYAPAHYLKQFHPKYTSEEKIKEMMEEEGFDIWADFFRVKNDRMGHPGTPTLAPWISVNSADQPVHIMERNPYYWKIDTEGNQLPYADKFTLPMVEDEESWLLATLAGDVDYVQSQYIMGENNYSIIQEFKKKGNYRLIPGDWIDENYGTIYFNYEHEDPVLRELFNDKRFRIALSVALNRDEMNELILKGKGTSSQPSSRPGPPYYAEDPMFKLYTEYDPDKANRLLDEIGLKWDKNHEYRLRPDDKRLRLVNHVATGWPMVNPEMAEMYRRYWEEIGMETVTKPSTWGVVSELRNSGDFDIATVASVVGGSPVNIFTTWNFFFPNDAGWYLYLPWGTWFITEGKEGTEPPVAAKRMRQIWEEGIVETSEERRNELGREAFQIMCENLWSIGVLNAGKQWFVVSNELRNVNIPGVIAPLEPYTTPTATWFLKPGWTEETL